MGLTPIVSLTDHGDIDAPMSLQAMVESRNIPIPGLDERAEGLRHAGRLW